MKDMTVTQQEQSVSEEQRIAKAVAEQEATRAQQWWEGEGRRAMMLRSIRAHRELTVPMQRHAMMVNTPVDKIEKFCLFQKQRQEKEQRQRAAMQTAKDELEAKREADRIFKEKQRSKALQIREDRINLQDFNATQTVALILRHLRKAILAFISLSSNPG